MKYVVAIPVYNGGDVWQQCVENIKKYAPADLQVQVIDSSSKDNSAALARDAGFKVLTISSAEFNHGGTRNQALQMQEVPYDVIIFLTQDALPQPGFLENIISVFNDPQVACAYGRQLPHDDANPLARHARLFNYPEVSHIYEKEDIPQKGLKVAFMSNSFSAYRTDVYQQLGGFPLETILCEDMYLTAKAVQAGYKVAYVADAQVKHSHNYSPAEEFRRYFDIGVFHTDEPWIRQQFGGAGGEGKKFIISELCYLVKQDVRYLPLALINNFMKIAGYKSGQQYKKIPGSIIKKLSMHKRYWNNK